MNLQKLSKKLRHVADTIDSLFIDSDNENVDIAKKILKGKKKLHWTQTAKGRKIMAQRAQSK